MLSSHPSTATLSRSTAIIALCTGVIAAYGCYHLLSSSNPTSPVRRSGAVHHRRRRQTNRPTSNGPLSEAEGRQRPREIDWNGDGEYGIFEFETESSLGAGFTYPLVLRELPSVDTLATNHQRGPDEAVHCRRLIEQAYLRNWLRNNDPLDVSARAHAQLEDYPGAEIGELAQQLAHLPGLQIVDISGVIKDYLREGTRIDRASLSPVPEDDTVTVAETSVDGPNDGSVDELPAPGEGQGLKQMLYYIAEQQSRDESYIHRGVTCNSCDTRPIRGIRWRCANCPDYDLCSDCEMAGSHDKTHIFYKVRIPAPFLGNPRQVMPLAYPGKPTLTPSSTPLALRKRLTSETSWDDHAIDALYDQFTCLANVPWLQDPNEIGAAIDRAAFNGAFVPLITYNNTRRNLLYDRMFVFYDTNSDQRIGFEEFVQGLACLHSMETKKSTKLRRIFDGYDLDSDGYVCRQDFLRIFRAYYTLQKELVRDLMAVEEADREIIYGGAAAVIGSSQPLSAAFPDMIVPDAGRRRMSAYKSAGPGVDDLASQPISRDQSDSMSLYDGRRLMPSGYLDRSYCSTEVCQRKDQDVVRDQGWPEKLPSQSLVEEDYDNHQEILFQVNEDGLNELLDTLFKEREQAAALVKATSCERKARQTEIKDWLLQHESMAAQRHTIHEQWRQDPLLATAAAAEVRDEMNKMVDLQSSNYLNEVVENMEKHINDASLPDLLSDFGAAIVEPSDSQPGAGADTTIAAPLDSQGWLLNVQEPVPSHNGGTVTRPPLGNMVERQPGSNISSVSSPLSLRYTGEGGALNLPTICSVGHDRDPTLPQHRPDSPADVRSKPVKLLHDTFDGNEAPPPIIQQGKEISQSELRQLVLLDLAEKEITKRGGPGKVSFEEFEKLMTSAEGRSLGFLEGWLELGSF